MGNISGPRNCDYGSAEFLGPEIVIMGQFLGPEIVIMGQQNFWAQKLTLWARDTLWSCLPPPCWVPHVPVHGLRRNEKQLELSPVLLEVLQQLLAVPLPLALERLQPPRVFWAHGHCGWFKLTLYLRFLSSSPCNVPTYLKYCSRKGPAV